MKHFGLVFPTQFQNRIVNFGSFYAGCIFFCWLIFIFKFPSCKVFKKSDLFFWYLAHLIKQPITKLRFRISFTLFVSLLNFWRYKQFVKVQDWKFQYCLLDTIKVIYPKYSKHWLSTVPLCSKSWFKSWVIIFTFKNFWVKKLSKLTSKFRIKI